MKVKVKVYGMVWSKFSLKKTCHSDGRCLRLEILAASLEEAE